MGEFDPRVLALTKLSIEALLLGALLTPFYEDTSFTLLRIILF